MHLVHSNNTLHTSAEAFKQIKYTGYEESKKGVEIISYPDIAPQPVQNSLASVARVLVQEGHESRGCTP